MLAFTKEVRIFALRYYWRNHLKASLAMAGYVDMKLDYSFKKAFSDREQLRAFLNDMLRGERVVKSCALS